MATFGLTITNGIQDISALLPLLGTDQCEKHAGIALEKGYLYAAATPLSLFGSLGIVKAAIPILLATLRFQSFVGAKKLEDAGFTLSGSVAPLIAFDPDLPTRYLAESRLLRILDESNIKNFKDLKITLEIGKWNRKLVASSCIASLLGIVPYLYLNLGGTTIRVSLAWTFPALRIGASYLCCIAIQLILQNRITSLIQQRILFQEVDLRLPRSDDGALIQGLEGVRWDSWHDAESCLTSLLNLRTVDDGLHIVDNGLHTFNDDSTLGRLLDRLLGADPERTRREMYLIGQQVILLLASIGIVIGYIGCFTVVQAATSPYGPLSWLCLEASLSLIRVAIWAWNPEWDDIEAGFRVVLELPDNSSVRKTQGPISIYESLALPEGSWERVWQIAGHAFSVTEHSKFREELEPYTGPLPPFFHPGYCLYLTLPEFGEYGIKLNICATVVHSLTHKAIFVKYTGAGGLSAPVFAEIRFFDNDPAHGKVVGGTEGTLSDMIDAKYSGKNISEEFPTPLLEDVQAYTAYIAHARAILEKNSFVRPIVTGWTITSLAPRVSSDYGVYLRASLSSAESANQTQRARWTSWIQVVTNVILREEKEDVCSPNWQSFLPMAQLLLEEAVIMELCYLERIADAENRLAIRQNAALYTIDNAHKKDLQQSEWRRCYNQRLREDATLAANRLDAYITGPLSDLRTVDEYHLMERLKEEYKADLIVHWEQLLAAEGDYSAVKDRLRRDREGLASSITPDTSGNHASKRLRRRVVHRLQTMEYWMQFFFDPVASALDPKFSTHYGLSEKAFPFLAEIMYSRCITGDPGLVEDSLQKLNLWLLDPEGGRIFLKRAFEYRGSLGFDTMYTATRQIHHKGWFNILGEVLRYSSLEVTATMPLQLESGSIILQKYPQCIRDVTAGSLKTMVYFTGEPSHSNTDAPLVFIPLQPDKHNSMIVEVISNSEEEKDLSLIVLHRSPTATRDHLKVSVVRDDSDVHLPDLDAPPLNGMSVMTPYKLPVIMRGRTKVTLTPSGLWLVRFIKVIATEDVDEWC